MATSGKITTTAADNRSITLSWALKSQDVAGNTSTISWSLEGSGSNTHWVQCGPIKAVINGVTVYGSDKRVNLYSGTVVASGTAKIAHTADGTKSFSLSCQAAIYSFAVNAKASGTHTLPTIPRASSVSAKAVNLGAATTITITRAASSFTHTLTYKFGSASGTIVTKTNKTSVSWTPPLDLAKQIPNTTSGTCTITCITYSGSTKVGSKTCTMKLTVPASVKPTITSLTATRVDGSVPAAWGIYVQGKSKATLKINGAAGSYGSTISSYSITGGGFTGTASSLTTGFLKTSGTIKFTATVKDSRGRTSDAATCSISVVAYSTPAFTKYSADRCNSAGTATDDGTYIKGLATYTYASCSSKNTVTRKTEYKVSSASAWTNASVSFTSGMAFTFGGGKISIESSYDVRYTISDAFTSVSVQDAVSTASVVMDFRKGGKGVAIGKVSEKDKLFEVAESWDVKMYGKLLRDFIYPVGSIYLSVKSTNPSSLFGGTWVAWGTGRVPVGVNASDANFSTVEKTGGASTVTLTASQIPSHKHAAGTLATAKTGAHTHSMGSYFSNGTGDGSAYTFHTGREVVSRKTQSAGDHTHTISGSTDAAGSGGSHTNLQPYITCYMWKRTA